VRHSLESRAR